MKEPRPHAHAELWLYLLKEQLGLAQKFITKASLGQIEFRSRDADGQIKWLGGLRIKTPGRFEEVATPGLADCEVTVDDYKARSFFRSDDVEPGTFEVAGNMALFESLLDAIDAKPPVQSWLQARSSK